MICRVAEQERSALGTAQIQMRRVLPGEADPTMNLDVLVGAVRESLRTPRLGDAGSEGEVRGIIIRGPKPVISGRSRALDLEQHVSALVFDRLERADRPAVLEAHLGVFHSHLQGPRRRAGLLGRKTERGEIENAPQRGFGCTFVSDEPSRYGFEL